jgi:hypothetical protein
MKLARTVAGLVKPGLSVGRPRRVTLAGAMTGATTTWLIRAGAWGDPLPETPATSSS